MTWFGVAGTCFFLKFSLSNSSVISTIDFPFVSGRNRWKNVAEEKSTPIKMRKQKCLSPSCREEQSEKESKMSISFCLSHSRDVSCCSSSNSHGQLWSMARLGRALGCHSPQWMGRLFQSQRHPANWKLNWSQRRVVYRTGWKFQPSWKLWHHLKRKRSKIYFSVCLIWRFGSSKRCYCCWPAFKRLFSFRKESVCGIL